MGVNDRGWMRNERQYDDRPVMVQWLVCINALVFLLGFFNRETFGAAIDYYGEYRFDFVFEDGQLWRLITYQFLHANMGHIFFNMICLWVFGGAVERRFGHLKFLVFYLVCGVAAALFSSLLGSLGVYNTIVPWDSIAMVGASGSIYGIIAASAVLFPHSRIMLMFPPIEMSVRTFALAVLGIAVAYIVFDWQNAGGEAGHMGGMLMGFLLMAGRYFIQLGRESHH